MAKQINMMVIAGDYEGKGIAVIGDQTRIMTSFTKGIDLNKDTVDSYEVLTEDHAKSAVSGTVRGLVGGALLGPVGLLGGALSAKNKSLYHVVVQFKDGKKSLLGLNDKAYHALIAACF